jgi:hypothetical protein
LVNNAEFADAVKSIVKSTPVGPFTEVLEEPASELLEHEKQLITVNAAALTPTTERNSFLSIIV